ncbi:MAG: hypothetical protein RR840_06940 [Clostridium sp.]
MNMNRLKKVTLVIGIISILFIALYFFAKYFADEQIKSKLNNDSISISQNDKTIVTFKLKDIEHVALYSKEEANKDFTQGCIEITSSFNPSNLAIKIYLKGQNPIILNYSSSSKTTGTYNYLSSLTKNL